MNAKHRFYCEALTTVWPAADETARDAAGDASNDATDDTAASQSDPPPSSDVPGQPSPAALSDATVELNAEESKHARRVLRLREGDAVELFDGCGRLATGRVADAEAGGRAVRVALSAARWQPRPAPWIDVVAALPKGPRADVMVDQLSQLGADRLLPLLASRTVVNPRPTKLERFAKAAIASAKQCGRAWLMEIAAAVDFAAALDAGDETLLLLADADGGDWADGRLAPAVNRAKRIRVLIGPEGGWASEEVAAAREAGAIPWRLGPHVLRIETAAAAAVTLLRAAGNGG